MLQRKTATANIITTGARDLIYFPVYSPFTVDTQGEGILPESLMLTAHHWMASGRMANVDIQHDGIPADCRICESFISIKEDSRFLAGTWAAAMRIFDPAVQLAVEKGLISGVSLESEYPPSRTRLPSLVNSPVLATGETELSLDPSTPEHKHAVSITFDRTANEVEFMTGESLGHVHAGRYCTGTEIEQGHAHRIDLNKLAVTYEPRLQLVTWLSDLSVIAISLVDHGANWLPLTSLKTVSEVIAWPDK